MEFSSNFTYILLIMLTLLSVYYTAQRFFLEGYIYDLS
jgi:hypothetical protein